MRWIIIGLAGFSAVAGTGPMTAEAPTRPGEPVIDRHGHQVTSGERIGAAIPAGFLAGGAEPSWSALGPFGGDVAAVAVSPLDPQVVLAGVAPSGSSNGALYRSEDGGEAWEPVSDLTGTNVHAIAFASQGAAFLGTANGIYRSVDGGESWSSLNIGFTSNNRVYTVAVDPNDHQIVWAGVSEHIGSQETNVLKSTDGGESWQDVTPPLAAPTSGRGIGINPLNSDEVLVAFGGSFGGGAVWSTADGGNTWVDRSAGLPDNPMQEIIHLGNRAVVVGGLSFGSQSVGVYETTTNGESWTALHDEAWPSLVVNDIAATADGETMLVATTAGAHRSTDGGASWTLVMDGTANVSAQSVAIDPSDPQIVFLGADSLAVLRSGDAGLSFGSSATGIGALDVYDVAVNPQRSDEIALAFQGQNNGGVYTSTDGGVSWHLENLPATRYNTVRFDPNGMLYAASDGPTSLAPEGLYRREAGGDWTHLGPSQGPAFDTRLYAIAFDGNDPDTILTAGENFGSTFGSDAVIWRSTDAGASWTKVHEGSISSETVLDLEYIADGSFVTVVAAVEDVSSGSPGGGVLRSTNGGQTWNSSNGGLAPGRRITSLTSVPTDPEVVFLGDRTFGPNSGVYRSDDGGRNWASTGYTERIDDIIADAEDGSVLYALLGQSGPQAFRSTDEGVSFEFFSDGLENVGNARRFARIEGDQTGLLIAATTGIWGLSLDSDDAVFADLNGDGVVDVFDLLILLEAWGPCEVPADCPADLNQDGAVDVFDLLLLLENWG